MGIGHDCRKSKILDALSGFTPNVISLAVPHSLRPTLGPTLYKSIHNWADTDLGSIGM